MWKLESAERDESKPLHDSEDFVECDICGPKPGIPDLCKPCLHNRSLIEALKKRIASLTPEQPPRCPRCDKWLMYTMNSAGSYLMCVECGISHK